MENCKVLDHHQSQIKAIFSLIGLNQVEVIGLFGRKRFSQEQLIKEVKELQEKLKQKAENF